MKEKLCSLCRQKFQPKRNFYHYCEDCRKNADRCQTCDGILFPIEGQYSCCGVTTKVGETPPEQIRCVIFGLRADGRIQRTAPIKNLEARDCGLYIHKDDIELFLAGKLSK